MKTALGRWGAIALGAYLGLVLLLHAGDAALGQGYYGRSLTVDGCADPAGLVLETVGPNVHERRAPRQVEGGQAQFSLPSRSIRSLALDVPHPRMLSVSLGGRSLTLSAAAQVDLTPLLADDAWDLPRLGRLYFPLAFDLRGRAGLPWAALALLLALALAGPALAGRLARRRGWAFEQPAAPSPAGDAWLAWALCIAALAALEWRQPLSFLQNDNYSQFTPKLLNAFNQLEHGHFPWWDADGGLGTPLYETGLYGVLDPLLNLSRLVTRALGRPHWLVDAQAFVCLPLGAWIMHRVLARLGVERWAGLAAAVALGLSGPLMKLGTLWYYTLPLAVYGPLLAWLFVIAAQEGFGARWALLAAAVRTAFFYAGNAQFFLYACLLEGAGILALAWRRRSWQPVAMAAASLGLSAGLCLPLALLQARLTAGLDHSEAASLASGLPFDGLAAALLPRPLALGRFPLSPELGHGEFTQLYYLGPLWALAFAGALGAALRGRRVPGLALLVAAALVGALCLGRSSLVYAVSRHLPVLGQLRYAFKLYPYAAALVIVQGALLLTWAAAEPRLRAAVRWAALASLGLSLLAAALGPLSEPGLPAARYPKPAPAVAEAVKDQVILPLHQVLLIEPGWPDCLPGNLPSLFNVRSFEQYEALRTGAIKAEALEAAGPKALAQRFGVSRILLQKALPDAIAARGLRYNWELVYGGFAREARGLRLITATATVEVYDTGVTAWNLKPLSGTGQVKELHFGGGAAARADLDAVSGGAWLAQVEWRPGLSAKADGKPVAVTQGPDGWTQLELPANVTALRLDYRPPGLTGLLAAGALLALLGLIAIVWAGKLPAGGGKSWTA